MCYVIMSSGFRLFWQIPPIRLQGCVSVDLVVSRSSRIGRLVIRIFRHAASLPVLRVDQLAQQTEESL